MAAALELSTARVRLAEALDWDASEAATLTGAIIARKGGGKTYLAGRYVEQLLTVGCPTITIDPVGNWWALRLAADGTTPGFPIVVLGGARGDIELDATMGEKAARFLVRKNASAVVDVSLFSKSEQKRFVADFCETLFAEIKRAPAVRMLVLEEAQEFAPQMAQGQERMLGAVQSNVRLGRNFGLGVLMLTQRPQSVSKDVLNHAGVLFVGQLMGAHERKAIDAWISAQADRETLVACDSLAALPPGDFWCWWPDRAIFERFRALPKLTLDASRTLKLGEVTQQGWTPIGLKEGGGVDVDALRKALGHEPLPTPIEETLNELEHVAQESGYELQQALDELEQARGRIAELEGQLREYHSGWRNNVRGQLHSLRSRLSEVVEESIQEVNLGHCDPVAPALAEMLDAGIDPRREDVLRIYPPQPSDVRISNITIKRPVAGIPPKRQALSKAELAIMSVVLQAGSCPDRLRMAALANYHPRAKAFTNAIGSLRTAGLIGQTEQGNYYPTEKGREYKPQVQPLPRGVELLRHYQARFGKAGKAILETLWVHGRGMTKPELAQRVGYHERAKVFTNDIGKANTMGLIVKQGDVYRINPEMRA